MNNEKNLFAEVANLSVQENDETVHKRGKGTSTSTKRGGIRDVVAETRPGDGVDPREEAKQRRQATIDRLGKAHGEHKEEQFFAQVRSALDLGMQSASDPVLNSLTVRDVARQGGSLVVVVSPRDADEPLELSVVNQSLEHASSMLSREVAAAITRKEAPHLKFVVLPASAEKAEE